MRDSVLRFSECRFIKDQQNEFYHSMNMKILNLCLIPISDNSAAKYGLIFKQNKISKELSQAIYGSKFKIYSPNRA